MFAAFESFFAFLGGFLPCFQQTYLYYPGTRLEDFKHHTRSPSLNEVETYQNLGVTSSGNANRIGKGSIN